MILAFTTDVSEEPLAGGGRYKFLQVDWLSQIHGPYATALKGPLCMIEDPPGEGGVRNTYPVTPAIRKTLMKRGPMRS